ncbi:probable E3 ubiquitin-protein ligase WAVH2 isoform X2 [Andrographis paniculata]|nr:probable E3 ubiquitin-protein ligase WAVH2 isoform X2 [Andrographis paniculata]
MASSPRRRSSSRDSIIERSENYGRSSSPRDDNRIFRDDDPVDFSVFESADEVFFNGAIPLTIPKIALKIIPEEPLVSPDVLGSRINVLLRLIAPSMSSYPDICATPTVDIVMVIEVTRNLSDANLGHLKRVVEFVIDNLGERDRLSIVYFGTFAKRILPLTLMNEVGRDVARFALSLMDAQGWTNIVQGLTMGARVLEDRYYMNWTTGIIFLSSGRDNCYCSVQDRDSGNGRKPEYLNLLPISICRQRMRPGDPEPPFPVYAFGLGLEHDPIALHAIASSSGGTYSFVESYDALQGAVARCLRGIRNTVAQNCILRFATTEQLQVVAIFSGRHPKHLVTDRGEIYIPDIYADEVKDFLVTLENKRAKKMNICREVNAFYKYDDIVSKKRIRLCCSRSIFRPKIHYIKHYVPYLTLIQQRDRLCVAEAIATALSWFERGEMAQGQEILNQWEQNIVKSKETLMEWRLSLAAKHILSNDTLYEWLLEDIKEIRARTESREGYENGGRNYALSFLSCHNVQRATTRSRKLPGAVSANAYLAPDVAYK